MDASKSGRVGRISKAAAKELAEFKRGPLRIGSIDWAEAAHRAKHAEVTRENYNAVVGAMDSEDKIEHIVVVTGIDSATSTEMLGEADGDLDDAIARAFEWKGTTLEWAAQSGGSDEAAHAESAGGGTSDLSKHICPTTESLNRRGRASEAVFFNVFCCI